jgi:thioredoxin-like negative regulator of GroEL
MSNMREITHKAEHDAFITNNPSAVLFFGSALCGHCQDIKPFFKKLAVQYPNVAFGHVEVSSVKTEGADSVPIFVGYKNGRPLQPVLGADEEGLRSLVQQVAR